MGITYDGGFTNVNNMFTIKNNRRGGIGKTRGTILLHKNWVYRSSRFILISTYCIKSFHLE